MAQTLSEGEVFNYTTTGAVTNGDMLVVGQRVGVALTAATGSAQVIGLALEGVYDVMCATTGTMTAGNVAYYRTATGKKCKAAVLGAATGTASGMGRAIGTFWETKTSGASRTTIKVKLIGGPMCWA
jgi:predicted RecA/RadA family phage recombinase